MPNPVLVESEIPGFEACFIRISGGWTVRELNSLYESREQWLELWRRKVIECRIDTADGEVLSDPATVLERWDDLDVAVARFASTSLASAVDFLATLGGAKRRVSSGGGGSLTTTKPPTTNATTI